MNENNNRFEQKDLSLNSKEIKKTKEDFVWRITETLKNTSEEIVAKEIKKEAAKTSNDLSELKDLINEDYVSKKGIKIDWEAYNKNHNPRKIEQELANTSTAEFLKNVHRQLREKRMGTQYLHLLEDTDFMV